MSAHDAHEALAGHGGTAVTLEVLPPDAGAGAGADPAAIAPAAEPHAAAAASPTPAPAPRSRHVTLVRLRGRAYARRPQALLRPPPRHLQLRWDHKECGCRRAGRGPVDSDVAHPQ